MKSGVTSLLGRLSLLAGAGLLASCAGLGGGSLAPVSSPVKLTVLHTNDHHGRFWKNNDGEYGLAARKTLIDSIRAEVKAAGGHTLLLDGGDVNTGVPESDTQDAEPDFKGMKAIGYDAMALGNHEFDKPLSVLTKQMEWAGFPMLSANIYKKDGTRAYKPFEVFDRGGLKIAVMGLTTNDTPKLTDPANTGVLDFRPPAAEAATLVPDLRKRAHVVIAATHMGHYPNGRGVNAAGDLEMAREVTGIDMIVGGHSQNPVCMLEQLGALRYNTAYVPGTACRPDKVNNTWVAGARVGQVCGPR
jgi:5'-nucleotidase / UDP-sugar diphosphatase